MKKALVVFIATAILTGSGIIGCKKVLKAIFPGLDVDVAEITVTIPFISLPAGTPVPADEIAFPPYTQHFNMDSAVRASTGGTFNANDVSSIKVKRIVLTVQNPDQQNNLANFESARVTFQSNSNTTPSPIASFSFADVYASTVTYDAPAQTPELRSYLNGTELTYNFFGKLRRFTTKALTVSVKVTLRVS